MNGDGPAQKAYMKEFNFGSVAIRRHSEASPLWSMFNERPELVADRGPQASALVACPGRQRVEAVSKHTTPISIKQNTSEKPIVTRFCANALTENRQNRKLRMRFCVFTHLRSSPATCDRSRYEWSVGITQSIFVNCCV
jgi:hypothetical protein